MRIIYITCVGKFLTPKIEDGTFPPLTRCCAISRQLWLQISKVTSGLEIFILTQIIQIIFLSIIIFVHDLKSLRSTITLFVIFWWFVFGIKCLYFYSHISCAHDFARVRDYLYLDPHYFFNGVILNSLELWDKK